MSETVNKGWLEDVEGNKFAPKTLMEQVLSPDGVNLINFLNAILGVIDISGIGDGTIKGAIDALNIGKQNIVSGVSDTEIGYLSGATSNIQDQINNKVEGSEYGRTIATLATKTELAGKSDSNHTHDDLVKTAEKCQKTLYVLDDGDVQVYDTYMNHNTLIWSAFNHKHDDDYYNKASINSMINSVGADILMKELPVGSYILHWNQSELGLPVNYGTWECKGSTRMYLDSAQTNFVDAYIWLRTS